MSKSTNTIATVNLYKNFPNPFVHPKNGRGVTNISFDIPKEQKISLCIYNIKGQKVRTLVNGKIEAGKHNILWDGSNDSNKILASGVYFYKLKTENKTYVEKMIMLN